MDLGLAGRTYIVTGGSAGIGLATVELLVQEGANVVACARTADMLTAALEGADPSGTQTLGVALDVATDGATEQLVTAARERFGRIDGIVNNVGTAMRAPLAELDSEVWNQDLNQKFFAALSLVQAVHDEMRERGNGAVVNVLSIAAKEASGGSMPTSVTRAAGLSMTKVLSKELGPDGIRVNAICVGTVKSAQNDRKWQAQAPELDRDTWYQQDAERRGNIPLGRIGEPSEAAAVIGMLLSDVAGYTTGVAVNVDGGRSGAT